MRFKAIYILSLFTWCLINSASSQINISGSITNKLGIPIQDASIMLMKALDSSVVAYSFSDQDGQYQIYSDKKENQYLLMIYSFNIKKQIKKISNQNQKIDFIAEEEGIELKEFSVKTEKIWGTGDTINYIVDAFRDSTDIVIGDVLKKMPGIEVKESGKIEYRGKPISKFYIEDMDMLQGRYGIATNNISATDIATVQVLENHQPVKALEDIAFTDDAAINLKLKPDAKGIFTSMADIGAGMDNRFLWNSSITGMYFSKKRQHLISLKSNNNGVDLEQEFQSFNNENMSLNGTLSSVIQPNPPQINKNRYLFNEAFGGTINNLFKTNDDAEITINLSGIRDLDDRNSYDQTSNIIPGEDTIVIKENMVSQTNRLNIEGGIAYKKNKEQSYLNTRLLFTGNIIETSGNICNNEIIKQSSKNNPIKLAPTIHWIKRGKTNKNSGIELYSQTSFEAQPYQLYASPDVLSPVLNDSLQFNTISQDVTLNSFETRNSLMMLSSVGWKSLRIRPIVLFSVENQNLNSQLSKSLNGESFSAFFADSLRNDLNWMRIKAGFSFKLTYRKRDFNFELSTPLQYQYIALDDIVKIDNSSQNRILFQPMTNMRYDINTKWELSASWMWYNQNPTLRHLYSGYILQNYRTLSHYESKLSDSYGQRASLKLSYKNIIKFLFASIEMGYNQFRNEIMYAQKFDGALMTVSAVELENTGNYFSIKARAGKGFDWKKLSINAEASWGKGLTPQLRQDSLIEYKSNGLNANMTFSLSITDHIQVFNKCSWSSVSGRTNEDDKLKPINNFIDAANLSFVLNNGLIFSMGFEYYDTRSGNRKQNFYLVDLGVTYIWKRIRFTLDYNNILNTDEYVYAFYGTLSSYYSEYKIRPASVLLSARFKLF